MDLARARSYWVFHTDAVRGFYHAPIYVVIRVLIFVLSHCFPELAPGCIDHRSVGDKLSSFVTLYLST